MYEDVINEAFDFLSMEFKVIIFTVFFVRWYEGDTFFHKFIVKKKCLVFLQKIYNFCEE